MIESNAGSAGGIPAKGSVVFRVNRSRMVEGYFLETFICRIPGASRPVEETYSS
jgi:hypothetical protein